MVITQVYDDAGNLTHDCEREKCEVSWDGFALHDGLPIEATIDTSVPFVPTATLKKGDPVPNHVDPDPALWDVVGSTAKLRAAR